jgi:hypothetical protein
MERDSFSHLILVRNQEEKTKLGKPRSGWENNVGRILK